MRTNWTRACADARRAINSEEQSSDRDIKAGRLRAGNSGIVDEHGNVAGSCLMAAHIRELGYVVEEVTNDKLIMFSMGHLSEIQKTREITHALTPGQVLRAEEECAIEWRTSNGTVVSGRPDLAIYGEDGRAVEGFELKSIASVYTTSEVLFEATPKLAHLCQAGHYMWQHQIPWTLIYTNYVNQQIPDWKARQLPPLPEELKYAVEFRKDGKLKQVVPFDVSYSLRFDSEGYVEFSLAGSERWTRSIVRWQDIQRFFEVASTIKETGNLGPRVHTMDALGHELSYSQCGMYCSAHKQFGQYEGDYGAWLAAVRARHQQLTGETSK